MMDLMEVIYEKLEDHAQNPPNPSGKSELLGKKMESSLSYLHDKIDMHHDILKDVVDEKIAKLHSTVNQGHSTISNIWMAVLVFGVLYVIKISVQAYFAKDGKQKSRFD